MTLGLETPGLLAVLLLLPLVAATARGSWLAACCRAGAVTAVVLALAGAHVERARPVTGTCVMLAVDASASVGRGGVEAARDTVAALASALGPQDLVGAVAFGGDVQLLAAPTDGARVVVADPDPSATVPGATDIGAALTRAAALCPADREAAILLVTDGNETCGSLRAEAALLTPRVPVFPIVPRPALLPPIVLRRLLAPAVVPAGRLIAFDVVVEARDPVLAVLSVRIDGASFPPVPVDLPAGITVVPLPYRFDRVGMHAVDVSVLEPPVDDRVAAAISVGSPLVVLVASERADPVVAAALRERGMSVEVVPPGELATRVAAGLTGVHLVVLDDVGSRALGVAAAGALARWVEQGGALVATGGAHLFGDPGWVGTPLERVLPVTLQSQAPEPKEREPIALYLLVDRSNSMGYAEPGVAAGEKMEYAKRAALAVLEQLSPGDRVGAIAFDAEPYVLGRLLPAVTGGRALAASIGALQYGGGTDFKGALEIALEELLATDRRVRHVILITDGDTNRRADDHTTLAAAYGAAGISITTIRIGSDAVNLDLLRAISRVTGGEFHHVENVRALPQLMIRDAQHAIDAAANRRERAPHVAIPGGVLAGLDDDELPEVARWAVTRPRPDAEVRLDVESDGRRDPLLATWQVGLGRTAVVPLDFQAGAAGWAAWRGFEQLWTQLAVWAAPSGLAGDRRMRAEAADGGTHLVLETVGDDDGPFAIVVPPLDPVPLTPVARRRFAAELPALAPGIHPAVLRRGADDAPVTIAVPAGEARPRERSAVGADTRLLADVAALTGGAMNPDPATVLAARPGVARERWPLDGGLCWLAVGLVLADVAARRR